MVLGEGRGGRGGEEGSRCQLLLAKGAWRWGERGVCRCRNLEKDNNVAAVRLRRAVVVPHCRASEEKESNVFLALPSYLLCTL